MATRSLTVTQTPVQLTDISTGDTYSARCVGANPIKIAAVAGNSAPPEGAAAWQWEPDEAFALQGVSGETIWAWSPRGSATIVYDEVQS